MSNIDYSNVVLSVQDLKKHFKVGVGKNKIVVPAIDGISFDIYKGEIFGLVGESGCGKTTTGRTIINLYNPTEGNILFNSSLGKLIVGAGYENHINRIKKAKNDFYIQSLQFDSYKNEKHNNLLAINQLKQNVITRIKDLEKIRIQLKEEKTREYLNYKNLIFLAQQEYIKNLEEAKFYYITETIQLKKQFKTRNQKKQLKQIKSFLQGNTNKKIVGIKESAALSHEEKDKQIKNLKIDLENKIADISKEFLVKKQQFGDLNNKEFKIKFNEIKHIKHDKIKQTKLIYHRKLEEIVKAYLAQKMNLAYPLKRLYNKIHGFILTHIGSMKQIQTDSKILLNRINSKLLFLNRVLTNIKIFVKYIFNPKSFHKDIEKLQELKKNMQDIIDEERKVIKEIKANREPSEVDDALQKIQMIFQDPIESLNPRMTVKEIISEGLIVRGIKDKAYIEKRVVEMLELVGLSSQYLNRYPHEFSGGQRQRIGVARALIVEPEFIIADEPISALDVSIQAQVINLLRELKDKLGLTILFIAHDLSVVKYFCDRTAVMYAGKIVELSDSETIFENPIHPYTKSLLSAIPQPDPIKEKLRKRIIFEQKNVSTVDSKIIEILPNHFVLANDSELNDYKKELKVST